MRRNDRSSLVLLILIVFSVLVGCTPSDEYELTRYKVTVYKEGEGTIKLNPDRTSFVRGSKVELEAVPEPGWVFEGWEGDVMGSENPKDVTVTSDMTIRAVFSNTNATYTLSVSPSGAGSVQVDPVQNNYKRGSQVTLTAQPAEGSLFSHWDGDVSGNANPLTITMESDMSVIAVFSYDIGEIAFGDQDLERAVRLALNIPSGPITMTNAIALTALDVSNYELTSLKGIEYLTALNWLGLEHTGISDVSLLANLRGLEVLNLKANSIAAITAIGEMSHLEELDLSENKIQNISSLMWLWYRNLRVLRLANNEINNLSSLYGLTNLEELTLGKNKISDIANISRLTQLKILDLSYNNISLLTPLSEMKYLEVLNLSGNGLDNVALADLVWVWDSQMREIYLDDNELTDLNDLYGFKLLEKVSAKNNNLAEISVFSNLALVEELDLSGNQIQDISSLEKCPDLKYLFLHDNQIEDISVLLKLEALEKVSLTNNALDLSEGSSDRQVIDQLEAKNVYVIL